GVIAGCLGGRVERPFLFIVGIDRAWVIAPQPAHHLRQNGSALLLAVQADAPRVVHVVFFLRKGVDQPVVLQKPIAVLVVISAAAGATVIVTAVLQKNSDRLLVAGQHFVGIGAAAAGAAQIGKAADDGDHLVKIRGPLPSDREGGDASRTR